MRSKWNVALLCTAVAALSATMTGCAEDAQPEESEEGSDQGADKTSETTAASSYYWRVMWARQGMERAIKMDTGGFPLCEYRGPITAYPFCNESAGIWWGGG